jgi:hypothetical protein
MKRSASEWWANIARDRGTTPPKLLREFGEKVAAFPGGGTELLDALERGVLGQSRGTKRLQRDEGVVHAIYDRESGRFPCCGKAYGE